MAKPNLMSFFQVVENSMVFTGNHLLIKIPLRYKTNELLIVENEVKALGIFEMVVNETHTYGLLLPCMLHMAPSGISRETIDEVDYQICEFYNGDKFLISTTLLKERHIAYLVYKEFIGLGYLPKFLDYNTTANLFDTVESVCGMNLKTPHSIFEMIYSFLFRDPDDLYKKYRHTDKIKKPVFIGSTNVSFGPESTISKLTGAYFNEGINSALVNASDQQYDLEDLLRK